MKKNKLTLYEQKVNPEDIFLYLPDSLKKKLSPKDKKDIKAAVSCFIQTYQKKYEEKYLDRMLI